jgi:phage I-like protein
MLIGLSFFLVKRETMNYTILLVLPKGKVTIDNQLITYEDKFDRIIDNFKNPLIENPKVIMNNEEIGRATNYYEMEDGMYFELEIDNELSVDNKYPVGIIEDGFDADNKPFPTILTAIIMNDTPQYLGQEAKELNKELQMPDPKNFQDRESWLQTCIPAVINEGKSQEQATAQCVSMWDNKAGATQQPARKSKIEILNSIKKMVEKSGYSISDEKILEMFGVIQDGNGTLVKLNKTLKAGEKKHVIQVFPKKSVYIEKYDRHINFNDQLFSDMIEGYNCEKLSKPFLDEEHNLGISYADITNLFSNEKGLFAELELNAIGLDAIKERKYKYISPEWGDKTDTEGKLHKNVLWAITLTNIPALEGENPTLQEQIKLTKKGGSAMNLSQELARLEGKVANYKLQDENMPAMPPEIMEAIAMIKEAIAKIDELTQQKEEVVEQMAKVENEKEVAEKLAEDYKGKLDTIETEKAEKEKEDFFEGVVTAGQLEAAEVDDYKLMYDKSPDIIRKVLTAKPKKTDTNQNTQLSKTSLDVNGDEAVYKGKKYKLTQEDYDIMEDRKFDRHNPKDVDRYIRDVLYEGGN